MRLQRDSDQDTIIGDVTKMELAIAAAKPTNLAAVIGAVIS
jgi:hypothetical protein